jgi:hypothetical protein
MKIPAHLFEENGIEKFLTSRQLFPQYKKAKTYILEGRLTGVFLKIVFTIDDHS